uniref:Uncharacterized protein n=1 Tax=Meloidogyne enterolobii TaxID=390850 RepID=A0A6V7X9H3_MELEN|nr:unnamed protein product [Meloidogyne enterolobii]
MFLFASSFYLRQQIVFSAYTFSLCLHGIVECFQVLMKHLKVRFALKTTKENMDYYDQIIEMNRRNLRELRILFTHFKLKYLAYFCLF